VNDGDLGAAEEWRAIENVDGSYSVSSHGKVRANPKGNLLAGDTDRKGYRRVLIRVNGKKKHLRVSRLVCFAFHGEPAQGHEVGHLDGDLGNNKASNLAWVSKAENARHQIMHGRHAMSQGLPENHPNIRLPAKAVREIRERSAAGESGRSLARDLGISRSHCARIINRTARATL
jgi:hypothetical protein